MNFIKHFLVWMEYSHADDRLTPHHVSLYTALFYCWNLNHFRNPISINREELMKRSKIGSVNTYTRCLKELDAWQYISYKPSYNSMRGSKVFLYAFDEHMIESNVKTFLAGKQWRSKNNTAGNKGNEQVPIKSDNGHELPDLKNDIGCEQVVSPSLNILNDINTVNNINSLNGQALENFNLDDTCVLATAEHEVEDRSVGERISLGVRIPASLGDARDFFNEQNSTATEAEKFFNYFQSNGWKVGGRAPMNDWKAAARNWILNTSRFALQTKPGLHVSNDKNYDELL